MYTVTPAYYDCEVLATMETHVAAYVPCGQPNNLLGALSMAKSDGIPPSNRASFNGCASIPASVLSRVFS
jgi:hypothetical protein